MPGPPATSANFHKVRAAPSIALGRSSIPARRNRNAIVAEPRVRLAAPFLPTHLRRNDTSPAALGKVSQSSQSNIAEASRRERSRTPLTTRPAPPLQNAALSSGGLH